MEKGWRVILAFVGIFAAGAVSGGLLTLRAMQSRSAAVVETLPAIVETPAPTVAVQPPASVASTPVSSPPSAPVPPPASTPVPAPTSAPVSPSVVAQLPPLQAPEQLGPQLFRRLTNQLELSPAQRAKIRPIELRATEELNRLRRDAQHSTQVLIDKNEDEIRALLTPQQLVKFEEGVNRAREKVQKYMAEQQIRQRELREKSFPGRGGKAVTPPAPASEKK